MSFGEAAAQDQVDKCRLAGLARADQAESGCIGQNHAGAICGVTGIRHGFSGQSGLGELHRQAPSLHLSL